jgi:hypothetical protein
VTMTSPRQVEANRVNSRASTGPRSAAGKSRSARNARRHGLSIPVRSDLKFCAEVEELALEIAGTNASNDLKLWARSIAEAQIDLMRIRRARRDLIELELGNPARLPMTEKERSTQRKAVFDAKDRLDAGLPLSQELLDLLLLPRREKDRSRILCDLAGSLIKFDRYERRALSRRNAAMKAFQDARQATQ